MNHLIISREFPPGPYPTGGIGTYVANIARLLAERGEMVHVIGQQWQGAPLAIEERCGGRLIIHRIPLDAPSEALRLAPQQAADRTELLRGLAETDHPPSAFAWQAALLAEQLHREERIDVIEGQDWEAPLHDLQIRRALGAVADAQPPCLVHLHSPTELIFRYNGWDVRRPDYLPMKRREDYSILAADALLCPSHYMARQLQDHFGLPEGHVQVIPYPVGAIEAIDRTPGVWTNGSICYVGRLEPRKGLLEWIDAALEVAHEFPDTVFDFVGRDMPYKDGLSVQQALELRIPDALRGSFRFHGARPRELLPEFLARARAAVVPSRWDSLPNTCIEAMASGLPVIASRDGGMAELVDDGRTGWLADAPGSRGLASALRRALQASGTERAAMGGAAARAVRVLCDDEATVERHLAFREAVAAGGPSRSFRLLRRPHDDASSVGSPVTRRPGGGSEAEGVALVVVRSDPGQDVDGCLTSIELQEDRPVAVAIVTDDADAALVGRAASHGWLLVDAAGAEVPPLRAAGLDAIRKAGHRPLGVSFLDPRDRLAPEFVRVTARALRCAREVGLVSFWTWVHEEGLEAPPCPALPYQWHGNEVASGAVLRIEALDEIGGLVHGFPVDAADFHVANGVMAAGWTAVTYPALLLERVATISDSREAAVPPP